MAFDVKPETQESGKIDQPRHPKGRGVAVMFGEYASEENSESHTHIPGHKNGTIGCATLVVWSQIDKHVLVGRIHVPIAKTDDEGCTVVAYRIGECCKKQVATQRNADT